METQPPIALRLVYDGGRLVIEAWDHSPRDPQTRDADADAEDGRGLMIVAAVSNRWGSARLGHQHKVVWAELAIPSPP
jgi:hypothetical protein